MRFTGKQLKEINMYTVLPPSGHKHELALISI